MAQARKKSRASKGGRSELAHGLSESFFLLTMLLAVYLVACLASYEPTDPGPFNTVASDQVQNIGRLLGAWLANFFLFLTGYIAYLIPVLLVYFGWMVYSGTRSDRPADATQWLARITGFVLFILSATGLGYMHAAAPVGSMPAGAGGVVGGCGVD